MHPNIHVCKECAHVMCSRMGPSIKYVTLFLANFDPSPVTHPGTPPKKYVTHLGPPKFLVGLVQKTLTKAPCTNSLSIVRGGFCPRILSLVWKVLSEVLLSVLLISECMCYNRKLNIT